MCATQRPTRRATQPPALLLQPPKCSPIGTIEGLAVDPLLLAPTRLPGTSIGLHRNGQAEYRCLLGIKSDQPRHQSCRGKRLLGGLFLSLLQLEHLQHKSETVEASVEASQTNECDIALPMRDPHFFLKSLSSSEPTFFTIFCSSIRKALTILQNMDPCMQLSEGHHRHMGTFSCAMPDG